MMSLGPTRETVGINNRSGPLSERTGKLKSKE